MHNPNRAPRSQAQTRGGKAHANGFKPRQPLEAPDLSTPEKQRKCIEQTIASVGNLEMGLAHGKFIIYAISVVRALTDDDVVKRLEALELSLGKE